MRTNFVDKWRSSGPLGVLALVVLLVDYRLGVNDDRNDQTVVIPSLSSFCFVLAVRFLQTDAIFLLQLL